MTDNLFSSTDTPLTPPESEEDSLSWLRLLRSRRVGAATFYRLMQDHGTASAALAALPAIAGAAGVSDYELCPVDVARAEMRAAARSGARMICAGAPEYPALLAELDDAPPILWAIGRTGLLARPAIAIVGARNASSLGERMARRLAAELGEAGFVVVSGLARGIDAAAHEAALATGTVAVLGGGADVLYPQENRDIHAKIGREGLRLSEQPMGLAPQARHFPRRNRLISGLCAALVVVEAAAKSGSLITARTALDQGREVLAVPGHPFDARASGCNLLIRDGARLVRGAADVIEALGPLAMAAAGSAAESRHGAAEAPRGWRAQAGAALDRLRSPAAPRRGPARAAPAPHATPPRDPAGLQGELLRRLGPTPMPEDALIRDLAMPAREVAPALLDLELDGRVQRHAGGLVSRVA